MTSGTVTTLNKANNKSDSLRTTIPSYFIKHFSLEKGHKLCWKLEYENDEPYIRVCPILSEKR